jgi:hypothetical protein
MRKIFLAALLLVCGCFSGHRYVEGTSLQLGAYVPWESNLYGVELVSYVNGCVVKGTTNQAMRIERTYNATNSYFWGMVETREHTQTSVEGR